MITKMLVEYDDATGELRMKDGLQLINQGIGMLINQDNKYIEPEVMSANLSVSDMVQLKASGFTAEDILLLRHERS